MKICLVDLYDHPCITNGCMNLRKGFTGFLTVARKELAWEETTFITNTDVVCCEYESLLSDSYGN